MGFSAEPSSKELGPREWQFYVQRPKKRLAAQEKQSFREGTAVKEMTSCKYMYEQFIKTCCSYSYVGWPSMLYTIADTLHGPVNQMSSLGGMGSTLSNQLGGANPRQVGFTNRGWLPVRATGVLYQARHPPQTRVSLEHQAQISVEVTELLSNGAITETRISPDQFVS